MTEERRTKNRENQRIWVKRHPDKKKAYNKAWRDKNPQYDKEYRRSHSERINNNRRINRLLKISVQ